MLTDVPPAAPILREEIFGPVAPIVTFTDEAEAIRLANDTEYGLVSYVYTGDLARGLRVSEAMESGMVGLNRGLVSDPAAPFGGTKQSGIGREGGHEGMLDYLECKYIAVPGEPSPCPARHAMRRRPRGKWCRRSAPSASTWNISPVCTPARPSGVVDVGLYDDRHPRLEGERRRRLQGAAA